MRIVYFDPNNGSRYRVGLAAVEGTPDTVVFCFGLGDHPMTAATITRREPLSFEHFAKNWNSIRLSGNVIDLWAGFMALRHVLGYATTWEQLPEQTRASALQVFEDGPWLSTPQRELDGYARGWQLQLQPLVEALAQ